MPLAFPLQAARSKGQKKVPSFLPSMPAWWRAEGFFQNVWGDSEKIGFLTLSAEKYTLSCQHKYTDPAVYSGSSAPRSAVFFRCSPVSLLLQGHIYFIPSISEIFSDINENVKDNLYIINVNLYLRPSYFCSIINAFSQTALFIFLSRTAGTGIVSPGLFCFSHKRSIPDIGEGPSRQFFFLWEALIKYSTAVIL